mmetsp:Transcript_588/g.530  ORF Transcript_588/g.530 Transcript_588/m.530 type:complete len:120 (-) Transcript_588:227-586(-)|eukprot:CAMPEP_0114587318 /NCGR_PEP_ID=MMETSP0125-20121206/10305_1 /TAXON_ID=485358 ORGANISM="Aristerostoma sp., Strain ATCC 50986" /NCGR_SAMPLE_ID=MMETSP0125 /ASSEMBLY_ACC=CAM_ASM_000245 /LENGTH=119 /DNA_ID=CAMNT_0001783163 /DNA_START=733 /DNA_END=1092 /DNA_ORIENTATION=+
MAEMKKHGEIDRIDINREKKRAIVTFASRTAAEEAIKEVFGKLYIKNKKVFVNWWFPPIKKDFGKAPYQGKKNYNSNIKQPGLPPPNSENKDQILANIGKIGDSSKYPSMNPYMHGGLK